MNKFKVHGIGKAMSKYIIKLTPKSEGKRQQKHVDGCNSKMQTHISVNYLHAVRFRGSSFEKS